MPHCRFVQTPQWERKTPSTVSFLEYDRGSQHCQEQTPSPVRQGRAGHKGLSRLWADRALAIPFHIFCGLFQVTEWSSETSFFACSWFRFCCLVAVSRHDPGMIFVRPLWTHTGWVFGLLRPSLPTADSTPVPSSLLLHPTEDPLQGALLVHSSWGGSIMPYTPKSLSPDQI